MVRDGLTRLAAWASGVVFKEAILIDFPETKIRYAIAHRIDENRTHPVMIREGRSTAYHQFIKDGYVNVMVPSMLADRGLAYWTLVSKEYEDCAEFVKAVMKEYPENVMLLHVGEAKGSHYGMDGTRAYAYSYKEIPTTLFVSMFLNSVL